MIGVIDVSGAVEILLQKEKSDKFSKIVQEAALIVAPDLYISELTNTFWKYYRMICFIWLLQEEMMPYS